MVLGGFYPDPILEKNNGSKLREKTLENKNRVWIQTSTKTLILPRYLLWNSPFTSSFKIKVKKKWYLYTICPGSSDPFYVVTYYKKWVTTSYTQYGNDHEHFSHKIFSLFPFEEYILCQILCWGMAISKSSIHVCLH